MSNKGKGVIFYGSEDAKTRLKHQTLVQEFMKLKEETDATRTKLETAKQRKLMLAAEVRFLRKRYKFLAETKRIHVLQEEKLAQPPKSVNRLKHNKKQLLARRGDTHYMLPPRPDTKLKRRYAGEEIGTPSPSSRNDHSIKKRRGAKEMSVLNYDGRIYNSREQIAWKAPVFDLNQSDTLFDLNQDTSFIRKDAPLPTRAPIFDLNEISMGDEDFQSNVDVVKPEDAKKSLMRGINDEQQKDLTLSICRNEGEGSTHVGKRKNSWQDPVALRV